jgi:quercetin dioxygenase-like cupin family protein/Fe2+ or Zn2+ uptake regulation protein
MDSMTTVSEVLNHLKEQGYTVDFNLENNCLVCSENRLRVHPEEFVVDKHYRFEGMSDPADEAVIYAISSPLHQIKGVLVNGYGIYSDPETDAMIKTLEERAKHVSVEHITDQVKFNEATPLRPEGDRLLDAPMVQMDLNAFKTQIKQEESWKTGDRNAITIFKNKSVCVVLVALHAGTEMKQHKTKGTLNLQVLEGHISFRTAMDTAELSIGQMIVLHPDVMHSVYAQEESVFLLTMSMS